jgi:hypothetical protein
MAPSLSLGRGNAVSGANNLVEAIQQADYGRGIRA